jgi:hypothetical protein
MDTTLVDSLISTYRTLNTTVRPIEESRMTTVGHSGASPKEIMRRFRDSEMQFSQALKERITGVPIPDIFGGDETPTLGMETADDTTAMLIAQFGTARESTIAMLRDLPEQEWDATPNGEASIRSRVAELVANDQVQMDRITALLGAT